MFRFLTREISGESMMKTSMILFIVFLVVTGLLIIIGLVNDKKENRGIGNIGSDDIGTDIAFAVMWFLVFFGGSWFFATIYNKYFLATLMLILGVIASFLAIPITVLVIWRMMTTMILTMARRHKKLKL